MIDIVSSIIPITSINISENWYIGGVIQDGLL